MEMRTMRTRMARRSPVSPRQAADIDTASPAEKESNLQRNPDADVEGTPNQCTATPLGRHIMNAGKVAAQASIIPRRNSPCSVRPRCYTPAAL
jgi:hypothetical protein